MTAYELPTSLNISGVDFSIRTDFRVIIDILVAMDDPDLDEQAKAFAAEGKTALFFARGKELVGLIAVADVIKPTSPQAVLRVSRWRWVAKPR